MRERQYWSLKGIRFSRHRHRKVVNLSKLSREDRGMWNLVWRCIKRTRPGLAKMLTEDEVVQEIRATFNADFLMYLDEPGESNPVLDTRD